MTRILATLALLLALAGIADAACVSFRRVRVVQQELVAAQVILPSYYPVQSQPQSDDLARRLLEVLERIEAKLDGGGQGLTMESVVKQDCRGCHQAGKQPKAGFVLVEADGKLAPLALEDQKLVKLRITTTDPSQRMPPTGMSPQKQRAVIEALRQ